MTSADSPQHENDEARARRLPDRDQIWYVWRADLSRAIATAVADLTGHVLDYGCGSEPYLPFFAPAVQYVGADFAGNSNPDVTLAADGRLPAELTERFDVVISTQVLEHVVDVNAYLDDCRRVLRPGGLLVLTTHGIWEFHPVPVDLHRWTMQGLTREIEAHGFRVTDARAVTVGIRSMIQQCQILLRARPFRGYRYIRRLLNVFADFFPRSRSVEDDECRLAIGYICQARKMS